MKTIYKITLLSILLLSAVSIFAQQTEREKGIELYNKGDYKGAAKALKKAAKNESSDALVWRYLGLSYLGQNDKKEAQKALEKAVALDGKDADNHAALGLVYLLRNNSLMAQKEAEAAIALSSKNAEAYYILGVLNFQYEFYGKAYTRAKKAIEINPNFAAAYLLKSQALVSNLALTFSEIGKTKKELLKEATEDLEKYLSLSPSGEDADFQREYLASLKFFSDYYNRPENQKAVISGVESETAGSKTGIKILSKPQAIYPDAARKDGVSGRVRLLVGFSAEGQISHILIVKSSDARLSKSAINAARKIKFEPATESGKPVSTVRTVEYVFTIY